MVVINEIEIIDTGLVIPHTPKECKDFLIKAKPVLQAIKAQIKLIEDIEDLENLRDDLKEKGRYISEMILDAEVKLGEFFQALPKAQGLRSDLTSVQQYSEFSNNASQELRNTTVTKLNINDKSSVCNNDVMNDEMVSNTNVTNQTKEEITNEMGFDKMTVSRFETLAKNKDLVEQVKQEARDNNTNPTRTQVLSLAKARKQKQEQKEEEYKEFCKNSEKSKKLFNQLVDSLGFIRRMKDEDIELSMMTLDSNSSNDIIKYIQEAQIKLATLKREANKYKGVKLWEDNNY